MSLSKRQANYQRDRDQLTREEEEEYEKSCEESLFRSGQLNTVIDSLSALSKFHRSLLDTHQVVKQACGDGISCSGPIANLYSVEKLLVEQLRVTMTTFYSIALPALHVTLILCTAEFTFWRRDSRGMRNKPCRSTFSWIRSFEKIQG